MLGSLVRPKRSGAGANIRAHTGLRHGTGFTLIEVLIGLVALAIVVGIAIPSYHSYVLSNRRTEAKSALLAVQTAQEKYYLAHSAYASRLTDPAPAGLGLREITASGFYRITLKIGATEQSYVATATPINGTGRQLDNQCGAFTLTDAGVRNVTGSGGAALCWK